MTTRGWILGLAIGIGLGATGLLLHPTIAGGDEPQRATWEYTALCPADNDDDVDVCRYTYGEEKTVDCRNIVPQEAPEEVPKKFKDKWEESQAVQCPLEVVNRMGALGWEYVGQYGTSQYYYVSPLPHIAGSEDRPLVFRRKQ